MQERPFSKPHPSPSESTEAEEQLGVPDVAVGAAAGDAATVGEAGAVGALGLGAAAAGASAGDAIAIGVLAAGTGTVGALVAGGVGAGAPKLAHVASFSQPNRGLSESVVAAKVQRG